MTVATRTNLDVCLGCREAACLRTCKCRRTGRRIEWAAAEADCPLGLHTTEGRTARPAMPVADLTGYNPDNDTQSPKHGSCCDPPRG